VAATAARSSSGVDGRGISGGDGGGRATAAMLRTQPTLRTQP